MKRKVIKSRDIYERLYEQKIKEREILLNKVSYLESDIKKLWDSLYKSQKYFDEFCSVPLNTVKRNLEKGTKTDLEFFPEIDQLYYNDTIKVLKKLKNLYSNVKELYKYIKKYNKAIPEYQVFKTIICTHNEILRRKLIDGNRVGLKKQLGGLQIVRKHSNKKRINWEESNILKQKIINRGGTPYKVLERDELNNPIKDNGGEHWFVYTTDINCWILWLKGTCYVQNKQHFSFTPSKPFITELNIERKSRVNVDNRFELLKDVSAR